MKHARELLGKGICMCGAVLIVAVGLPLLAVATVVLRPVLVSVVMVAAVGGAILYCVPNCRVWLDRHMGLHKPAS